MTITIQEAKKKHEASILRMKGVVSVGIGLKDDSTQAIIVGLKTRSRHLIKKIPKNIEGYPVEIRIIGTLNAFYSPTEDI